MKIRIYSVDDWEALFVDGVRVFEHHSVDVDTMMEAISDKLNIDFEEIYGGDTPLEDYAMDTGSFPSTEKEILTLLSK